MANLATTHKGGLARRRAGSGPLREFLAFSLAGELYGIDLDRIREILGIPPITFVPRMSPEVVGVCSVRGLLVTIVDLRRLLRLEQPELGRRARILLLETDSDEVIGFLVDEVHQVVRVSETEVELAANVLGGDVSEHISGIARPAGDVMILLDLGGVFSAAG